MNKTNLLDRISKNKEDRLLCSRILDQAEQTKIKNIPMHTSFLSPPERRLAEQLLSIGVSTNYFFWGGYEGAERVVLFFLPTYLSKEAYMAKLDFPITMLQTSFSGDATLTHRDFLGAILGMGVKRENIGDILVDQTRCTIFLLRKLESFFMEQMDQVKRCTIQWHPILQDQLEIPEQKVKPIFDTVATLRLDAVLASGFSLPRSKASELILAGRASLNALVCNKPDQPIKEDDVISARGLGKCKVKEANRRSKKGRIILHLERYL